MNFIQKATLGAIGGLDFRVKKVGNQLPLVEGYRDNLPILQKYTVAAALNKDVKENPFLYSALRKKADAIASVPFYVEEFKDGKWVRINNHEAENLIENANPYMSGFELKKQLVYHKELTGSAFMQIVMVDGRPRFLQPLFPQHVRVIPSEENFLTGFEYQIGSRPVRLRPGEVFWTKHADPSDPYKGLSPLEAISGEIQTDLEARKWNKISLANRGASDVAFIMRNVVSEEDYQFARMMIEDRMSGPDNARRPWVLGGDSDVRPLSYTAVEMDYINTRKFNREVIAAALGVPAPLIGDADNSTYNNLDTLKRDFWQDTITNWLEELRQDLTRQLLIPYYGDNRRRNPTIRYMYDLTNVEALQANMAEKADIAKTLSEAGFGIENINLMLEFGLDVSKEVELASPANQPVEDAPSEEDEEDSDDVAEEMATRAVSLRGNPESFKKAILSIHGILSQVAMVTPDPDGAHQRASHYLDLYDAGDEHLASYIALRERTAVG